MLMSGRNANYPEELMQQHPLSQAFPAIEGDEFVGLVARIKKNGLRQPIVMFEGQVLDGWHRYLACQKAGVQFREIEYRGGDPIPYVEDLNLHRRHLTASQRALIVVKINDWCPMR